MIAIAPTTRPPAPRPCKARNPINSVMLCAAPDSAEPARKTTIDVTKMPFRPYMSPILPQSGVETVVPSTYAVTTQDRCESPPRSLTIVGIAVPTMKLSSMASMNASMRPGSTTMTSRRRAGTASTCGCAMEDMGTLRLNLPTTGLLVGRLVSFVGKCRPLTCRPSSRIGNTVMDKTDTRSRIQEVALRLFIDKGYEATSLREIAEELGVTKAALYYHFDTKEKIVTSLIDDRVARLEKLAEWGRTLPQRPEGRAEFIRRYAAEVKRRRALG